ncbi:hypothetical protein BZG36_04936 [Bifiguratus adelaidae]|uniref:Yeast cell wall synthesis Kre9/Knh1-like N-terminal domain-containing protein n=1 Tax=Bifiguratus adelaidae TaxID=1938954 RepID=A0A261XX53_9FUNG|nr:hypothetical protein BZG36_04936 [Bifiguratus adelaidae]
MKITALLFTVASILAPIVTAASSAASKTTAKSSAPASSSTAAAQSYIYVTEPVSSTTFIAGQSNTVAWLYKSGTGAPTTVTLELLNNKLLQNVIASNVSAKAGKYSWKVPANTGTSSAYALRFTDPTSGYTSYSANFTIQGSSSASGAMATGSSVAAMSSKAASGSASANSTSDALSLMNNHKTSTLGLVSALLSVMALL